MKLNGQSAYNLKIVTNDYITNQKFGFCVFSDPFELSNYIELDVFEFENLYKAVCNMKDLIEKEREKNEIGINTNRY